MPGLTVLARPLLRERGTAAGELLIRFAAAQREWAASRPEPTEFIYRSRDRFSGADLAALAKSESVAPAKNAAARLRAHQRRSRKHFSSHLASLPFSKPSKRLQPGFANRVMFNAFATRIA
jgi:hypothetical protein